MPSKRRPGSTYGVTVQLEALVETCVLFDFGFDCEEIDWLFEPGQRYCEACRTVGLGSDGGSTSSATIETKVSLTCRHRVRRYSGASPKHDPVVVVPGV